jgi:hypothetical protein
VQCKLTNFAQREVQGLTLCPLYLQISYEPPLKTVQFGCIRFNMEDNNANAIRRHPCQMSSSALAAGPNSLIGAWKLISWQAIDENEPPQDVFGSHPRGYLILIREGHGIVLTTRTIAREG